MMKKLLYIFMCLAMTQACIKENFPTSPNDVTEGEEVTLSMSVSVPGMEVATRALGEYDEQYANSHPTLWVVVFDQQGYFVQAAKATSQEFEEEDGFPYNTNFKVQLTTSPEQRILHFLLNYSGAETLNLQSGHESTVIGSLTADSDNQDVYWQRVVLPYGIVPPKKNDSPNQDYKDYVEPYVTKVPLIRNFAKVTVSETVDNFTIVGFSVMNRPNRGTVAPYADGRFVNYLQTVPENGSLYDVLTNDIKYHGTTPEVEGFEYYKTTLTDSDFVDGDKAIYLYESTYKGVVEQTPTVIIKGTYNGDTAYYKADLVVQSVVPGQEKYADILRNFEYKLIITSVAGPGKTLDEAVKGAANNNLSGSVQIQELTNITNGVDGLYVSATDITVVEKKDLVIRYKFVKGITGEKPTVSNGDVSIFVEDGEVIAKKADGTYDVTCASDNASGDWREVTVKFNDIPSSTKMQKIIFYDNREDGSKLRREVLIRYRPKIHMDVECVPESVASVPGTPVVVNIKIPQGLNNALFPLEFAIEANTTAASNSLKQYISPAKSENTSVRTGETIVTERNTDGTLKYAGAKSYQYIKKLSFEEYETLVVSGTQVVLPVYFVTNTATSASTVYVRNTYFADDSDHFNNFNASYKFSNLNFGSRVLPGANKPVTFTFNMDSAAQTSTVTVTLSGLKPAAGSGLSKVDGTTNQYTYKPTAQAVSLNLQTTQESGDVSVILAADSYVGAVAKAPQDLYSFSDLAFSGNVPAKDGEGVTFTFNMDTAAPNVPVTVTLVGLEPATGSGLTHVEGTSNQYTFTPSEEDVTTDDPEVSLSLKTTQESVTVSVSLAAGHYNNASLSAEQKNEIVIPANNILAYINRNGDSYRFGSDGTIEVFVQNPGNSQNNTPILEYEYTRLGDGNNRKYAYNTNSITIPGEYTTIYLRYYRNAYYVGEVNVAEVVAKQTTVNLNLVQ